MGKRGQFSHGGLRMSRTGCACTPCDDRRATDRKRMADRERARWQDPAYRDSENKRQRDRRKAKAAAEGRTVRPRKASPQTEYQRNVIAADTARRMAAVERMRNGPIQRRQLQAN